MTEKEMAQIRQIAEVAKANTVTPSDGYTHTITICKNILNGPYGKNIVREQAMDKKEIV